MSEADLCMVSRRRLETNFIADPTPSAGEPVIGPGIPPFVKDKTIFVTHQLQKNAESGFNAA